jgi:hypothetical protein
MHGSANYAASERKGQKNRSSKLNVVSSVDLGDGIPNSTMKVLPSNSRPATLDDLKMLLRSLNAYGVEYFLVGGYALAAHGYPLFEACSVSGCTKVI